MLLNSIFGLTLYGTFTETIQANSCVTYLFRVEILRNKGDVITNERNHFEFDFENDSKEQMYGSPWVPHSILCKKCN